MRAGRFASSFALALMLAATPARASSTFPAVVEKVVGAKVTCASCHRALDAGTDLTLFGAALKARGAVGKDDASLEAALAKMKADSVDSDGDGARDLDELAWGGDPNVPDLAPTPEEEAHYGFCGVGAGGPGRSTMGATVTLAIALLARATGRARRQRIGLQIQPPPPQG